MFLNIIRRLGGVLLTVWLSSVVIFGGMTLAPGSRLGVLSGGRSLSPEQVKALTERYHLNEPVVTQYFQWLFGLLRGDLGVSLVYREPVAQLLGPYLQTTLSLVLYAAILTLVGGIGLGIVAAQGRRWVDTTIMGISTIGMATPTFVAALGLVWLFAIQLPWFPVFGPGSGFQDRIVHLTLPAIAIAIAASAWLARITRTSVRTEQVSEHVEMARSRGLSASRILRRHVVRNAMMPISTASGLIIAGLFSWTIVVETVFGLGGIGSLLSSSVQQKDFAVAQVICLIIVVAYAVINTIVDVLYTVIDPRVRIVNR